MVHSNRAPVLAVIAGTLLAFFLSGSSCFLRSTIGLPCPGCGMTRATLALLRMDFAAAFFFHPLVFLVIPFIIILTVLLIMKKTTFKKSTPAIIAIGACMVIVYIIRMVLFFPDTEPMTYEHNSVVAVLYRIIRGIIERIAGAVR